MVVLTDLLARASTRTVRRRREAITSRDMSENGDHGDHGDPGDELHDEDFPLGDGTADTEATVVCPYCGQENEIAVDPGSGDSQEYIEDCQVCCRPWRVMVSYDGSGEVSVHIEAADDI